MKAIFSFLFVLIAALASAQADTTLNEFKGVYKFPDGSVVSSIEVVVQEKGLSINSSMGSSNLPRISKDTFSLEAYNGIVVFTRNKEGKVSGVFIDAGGTTLEGSKEEPRQMAWIRRKNLTSR